MCVKVQVVKNGNKEEVVIHGAFKIGRLIDGQSRNTFAVKMEVKPVKMTLREILKKHVPSEEVGDWDSTLNEYVNYCVLEKLGVVAHPIEYKEGNLVGFDGDYEVVDYDMLIKRADYLITNVSQEAYDKDDILRFLDDVKVALGG